MDEQFIFPVYVRFKHLSISDEHVPLRKNKDFKQKQDGVIHITLDELAEFMQDQSIVDWETVLLRITSNDLRHIMSMQILGMIIEGLPGVTLANKVEFWKNVLACGLRKRTFKREWSGFDNGLELNYSGQRYLSGT